ncbi:chemotaxis protein CheA [Carboxydothermus hydrogenoformans Z-2901]|uniref:Chemotaxis protein CheA n=1 Tax=Carboxydothermus hydrogenoformans (strain ATCC BAA-161 / DSM 6008 / Z-2901) TaxID=246194 RepID=Q3ADA4_CARHZ|nr:chemotaxis protein CheA [Carboxydothermus hydrogenoformans Z-2901]
MVLSDLRETFVFEAQELLEQLEPLILDLEINSSEETINALFRIAHTLKGSAGIAGINSVKEFTHYLETVLEALRSHEIEISSDVVDLLLEAFDHLGELITALTLGEERPYNKDIAEKLAGLITATNESTLPAQETNSLATVPLLNKSHLLKLTASDCAKLLKAKAKKQNLYQISLDFSPNFFYFGHRLEYVLEDLKALGNLVGKYYFWREVPNWTDFSPENLYLNFELYLATKKSPKDIEDVFLFIASEENSVRIAEITATDLEEFIKGEVDSQGLRKNYEKLTLVLQEIAEYNDREQIKEALNRLLALFKDSAFSDNPWLAGGLVALIETIAELVESDWEKAQSIKQQVLEIAFSILNEVTEQNYVETNLLTVLTDFYEFIGGDEGETEIEVDEKIQQKAEKVEISLSYVEELLKQLLEGLRQVKGEIKEPVYQAAAKAINNVEKYLGIDQTEWEGSLTFEQLTARLQFLLELISVPQEEEKPAIEESKETKEKVAQDTKELEQENLAKAKRKSQALKISQELADKLLALAGELIIAKNSLPYLVKKLEMLGQMEVARELKDKALYIDRLARDFQDSLMELRLLPVENIFKRFPRFVRDTAKQLNKQVNLVLKGEETKLEKDILEELYEPLLHLVRNSLDHGLEEIEERITGGKPATGLLELAAYSQGNKVIIEVKDDGRGINREKVLKKARENGLITAEEASRLRPEQVYELIFKPGFSTKDEVTDISGRGVGMDVVKQKVNALGGQVEVFSEEGKGTTIRLILPISMATTEVLKFTVGGKLFGIPLYTVRETVNVPVKEIKSFKQKPVVVIRNNVIPLVNLAKTLGLKEKEQEEVKIIILHYGFALIVDDLQGKEEVIIKPLTGELSHLSLYEGASILGDGSILLILAPTGLMGGEM